MILCLPTHHRYQRSQCMPPPPHTQLRISQLTIGLSTLRAGEGCRNQLEDMRVATQLLREETEINHKGAGTSRRTERTSLRSIRRSPHLC